MNETHEPAPELPDQLSDLLELAVRDMRSLDRQRYFPNAYEWHVPMQFYGDGVPPTDDGRRCACCLAGSVMAQTLKTPITENQCPYMYEMPEMDGVTEKLTAIDSARMGDYRFAWDQLQDAVGRREELTKEQKDLLREINGPTSHQYFQSWEEADRFLERMDDHIQQLRSVGL